MICKELEQFLDKIKEATKYGMDIYTRDFTQKDLENEYDRIRKEIIYNKDKNIRDKAPNWLKSSRNLNNFKKYIYDISPISSMREQFLEDEFNRLILFLEEKEFGFIENNLKISGILDNNSKNEILEKDLKKIFISHSSKDKKYAESLVELLIKKGVNQKNIRCTSLEETGFKPGEPDFLEKIKEELIDKPLFICLFSENYLNSPICLNEMGAGWISSDKYLILLTPKTDFKLLKNTVFERVHSIKINTRSSIANLLTNIKDIFLLEELEYIRKDKIITNFLDDIQNMDDRLDNKDLKIEKNIQIKEIKNTYLSNQNIDQIEEVKNKTNSNILLELLHNESSLGQFLLSKEKFFLDNILKLNEFDQIKVLNSIEESYVRDTGYNNYKNYEIFGTVMYKIIKTTKHLKVKKIALKILRGCSEYRTNLINIYQMAKNEIIFQEFNTK